MRWAFIGTEGSRSEAHIDPLGTHAWMWVIDGQKRWRLASADLDRPQGFVGLQARDDLLFVPAGWVHEVVNEAFTVAVSHNFIASDNAAAFLRVVSDVLETIVAHAGDLEAAYEECEPIAFGAAMAALQHDLGIFDPLRGALAAA